MKKVSRKKELMDRLIKEDVVKAVLKLIRQDRSVTMDEVALQCGVAKGTLYNYFKNKKELLSCVHKSVIFPIKQSCDKLFEAPISPREKLHTFVDDVFGFQKEYPLYFKFIQSQRSAAEATTERMTLTIRPLTKVCREGIRLGLFVDVDPHVMAAMIFGTVIGSLESFEYREDAVDDAEKLKNDIICLLERILLKQEEKL